ncbi:hypothetical protein PGTUg99_008720 [Puccinia graminis f. sp. tritici]|uniref:F-box domain-containing protein n=2 Tax=Puccinia graminis f. sp. tritici TaxID=56615 RepID=A0A5B0MNQ3_PUCGR|nr:hypothetical protein PGTUg99_008720 [Puccinia graminis f. sp. tritici]
MAVARDPNLPVTRVFQRGINAFKAGDYQRAIQCFDQAFQASSSTESIALRINILDSRAAAKDKLNDLRGSLSDSKKVIDLAPESPKTLRAELQQVRLQEQTHMATPGISRAPSSSTSSKPKSDLVGKMPFEIFIDIVSLLDTPTRVRCMGVCSSWRQAILNTPRLWNNLSLNAYNHQKLLTKAKYWLDRLEPDQQLHTLNISPSPIWPPSTVRNLLTFLADKLATRKAAPNTCLRSFSFHQAGTSHGIGVTRKTFADVIAFAYSHRANLFNLELQLPGFITCWMTLPTLLADFPLLNGLKLQGSRGQHITFKKPEDFSRNRVPSSTATHSGSGSPDGNSPSTSGHSQSNSNSLDVSPPVQKVWDQLETLFIHCTSFMPSEELPLGLPSLRSLSLITTVITASTSGSGVRDIFDLGVPGIDFTHLSKLENLEFSGASIGEEQWEPVWRTGGGLPRLKRVRFGVQPHFIPALLELANISPDWSPPQDEVIHEPLRTEIAAVLPELELISLSSLDSRISYKFVAVFGHQFTKLESLSVAGLQLDSDTEPLMVYALRHLPALVNLNLGSTNASPGVIEAIKPGRLEYLKLANCPRVTFWPLSSLVAPKNLHFLDIRGCHLISTREMLEWLARRVTSFVWQEDQDYLARRATRRLFLD